MTETPRTTAGRALVGIAASQSVHLGHLPEPLPVIVARIEAEAAQDERRLTVERIRERVASFTLFGRDHRPDHRMDICRGCILDDISKDGTP